MRLERKKWYFSNRISLIFVFCIKLLQKPPPLSVRLLTFSKVGVLLRQNDPFYLHQKKECSLLHRLLTFIRKGYHSHALCSLFLTWPTRDCSNKKLLLNKKHTFYQTKSTNQQSRMQDNKQQNEALVRDIPQTSGRPSDF